MTKENRLFLIDGMALIYRAHFAMINNPLMTRDGRHTSAIFGFMNGMMKVIRDENPDHLAVVLDSPQPTFRHEIYTDYKATREKMPEELVEQLQPLYDLLTAANIPIIRFPGYEADDIIGTLAYQAHDLGWKTYMVTGDKDMMQLVTDSVFMYTPGNRFKPTTIYDRQGVLDKWGVGPEKIIELLALVGDSSDNVPGIDGVGPKTAVKLLNEYGTLENIVENAEYLRNKRVRNGFLEGKDILPMSKDLVTIRLDVPVALHLNELQRKAPDFDALEQQLSELEMTSLLRQFQMSASAPKNEPSETVNPDKNYTIVLTDAELKAMIKKLSAAEIISFDVETTSVTALIANLVGMSFSIEAHAGWYIPIDYPERNDTDSSSMNLDDILKALKPLFEDEAVKFCGQNIKYDALVMSRYNIEVNGIIFDTMIAAHLLRPEANSYKLDVLSRDYLHYQMVPISDLIGSGKNQKSMAEVPLKEIFYYAAEDADIALQITGLFKEQLKDQEMEKPFYEVEMPLVPVLIEMEKNGVYLDLDFLKTLSVDFGEQLDELEEKIHDLAGSDFNVNSPQQLAVILFDELGLKPIRKRSTDVNVLERLKNHHPPPKLVLDYRHLKKLKSTYIDAFPQYVNPHTGRVHTSLNQTIAATGRLSSTNPNFQNIPIRTELGRDIRKAFRVQNPGYVLLSADYSQVEL
nr:DNA polymerase I [FCB group bacterium]